MIYKINHHVSLCSVMKWSILKFAMYLSILIDQLLFFVDNCTKGEGLIENDMMISSLYQERKLKNYRDTLTSSLNSHVKNKNM